MNAQRLGKQLGSREYLTGTDDSRKDHDAVAWVLELDERVREEWLAALRWVRTADRIVESAPFGSPLTATPFYELICEWRVVRKGGASTGAHAHLVAPLVTQWQREQVPESDLRQWDLYLESLWRYRDPAGLLRSEDDYLRYLKELSGAMFRMLPYQPAGFSNEVIALGMLDQFFNNLRDLAEDVERGLYFYPRSLLAEFSLSEEDLPNVIERSDERFVRLHEHLFATLISKLTLAASPLFFAKGLHPSWRALIASVRERYDRIEHVARRCGFNARAFQRSYWSRPRAASAPHVSQVSRWALPQGTP